MRSLRRWLESVFRHVRDGTPGRSTSPDPSRPRIGLALGGGFARGIAHIGVLKTLQEQQIPIDCIAGTSVGALVAALYAAGAPLEEMERHASVTRFKDFGRWTLSWLGLASNERLERYLRRVAPVSSFAELRTPLAIAATDLRTGEAVLFTDGDLGPPLRASCAYPGMFQPVDYQGRTLADGFLTAPVPVEAVRRLGADYVIAVYLESGPWDAKPRNLANVIQRSFAILQSYAEPSWESRADVVIRPDVKGFLWDDFAQTPALIVAGETATRAAIPRIRMALAPVAHPARPRARPTSAASAVAKPH